jgi:ABC-type dipeptide/oligopeptide/nickel transport system permease component
LVIVILVGIPLGILAAVFRNRIPDYLIVGGATVTSSIPSFVLAPIAMIVFVAQLHILPSVGLGWQGLFSTNIVLPALTLAAGPILGVVRYMRSSVVEVLSQDYIRAARARGLAERQVIGRHVVRNAFTPLLTVLGLTAAGLVSGSLFVETIFNIPGLGQLAGTAFTGGDVQASTGVLLVSALIIMLANLLVDLGYSAVDPRVQLGR